MHSDAGWNDAELAANQHGTISASESFSYQLHRDDESFATIKFHEGETITTSTNDSSVESPEKDSKLQRDSSSGRRAARMFLAALLLAVAGVLLIMPGLYVSSITTHKSSTSMCLDNNSTANATSVNCTSSQSSCATIVTFPSANFSCTVMLPPPITVANHSKVFLCSSLDKEDYYCSLTEVFSSSTKIPGVGLIICVIALSAVLPGMLCIAAFKLLTRLRKKMSPSY